MTLKSFKRLKDLVMRAAATDSDAELVQSFRLATLHLATHGFSWAQALDRVVTVVNEVEEVDLSSDMQEVVHNSIQRFAKTMVKDDLERLFEDAMDGASGSFLEMLESIHAQWEESGSISPRQRQVVEEAAERHAEIHPGGRVR